MTNKDIARATRLLAIFAPEISVNFHDSAAHLTAHWAWGGESTFKRFSEVTNWLTENRRQAARPPIGDRIRAARLAAGVSQTELATRSGIWQPWLSRIESGYQKDVQTTTAERIADALGISPRDLFVD